MVSKPRIKFADKGYDMHIRWELASFCSKDSNISKTYLRSISVTAR